VRGWANYYRRAASSNTFAALDHSILILLAKQNGRCPLRQGLLLPSGRD
jgi:hypothetical protein